MVAVKGSRSPASLPVGLVGGGGRKRRVWNSGLLDGLGGALPLQNKTGLLPGGSLTNMKRKMTLLVALWPSARGEEGGVWGCLTVQ